jgi:hypothetical protein
MTKIRRSGLVEAGSLAAAFIVGASLASGLGARGGRTAAASAADF